MYLEVNIEMLDETGGILSFPLTYGLGYISTSIVVMSSEKETDCELIQVSYMFPALNTVLVHQSLIFFPRRPRNDINPRNYFIESASLHFSNI